ncbi:uncharacterized protein [Primulina huaijiensis]|uniref:uncharacterized protein n=1 Tax=Primulina huaijiensis TaxID=1492673 RepID=UPI003CC78635
MGEIDTKPIESVQSAVSFFDHSNEQRQISPKREEKESQIDNELDILAKELANVKVQLEVKDSTYKQTLLKLDHHQKMSDELSKLLKNSDHQKNFYINEFQEANARINELESSMNMMVNKLSESEKLQEQITVLDTELASTQGQLVNMERDFSSLRQEKDYFVAESEVLRTDLNEEKRKTGELTREVSQLNEQILGLEMKVDDVKQEKEDALLEKRADLDSAEKALAEAEEKLEKALKDLDVFHDLENQLVEKSAHVESLEMDLKHANELQRSSENAASEAVSELNNVKETMELLEQRNVDQTGHIDLIETELKQLTTELGNAKEEISRLGEQVEDIQTKLESSKEKENDAEAKTAMLNFELHKARSKLAASEAAEARAQSEKSALFNALQEMGLEIEETKKENRVLREEVKTAKQSENSSALVEEIKDPEAKRDEECRMLIRIDDVHDNPLVETSNQSAGELENVRKELEIAISKVGEFRNRAEQAITRAEAAERAKATLELQMKKIKEHKERRKAALSALREESVSREFSSSNRSSTNYDHSAKNYQPLGKVLNMKF